MGNCLVNTFKGTVEGGNLPLYGKTVFIINNVADMYMFIRAGSSSAKATLVNCETRTNHLTEINLTSNQLFQDYIDASADGAKIIVDAYSLKSFSINKFVGVIGGESLLFGDQKYLQFSSEGSHIMESIMAETSQRDFLTGLNLNLPSKDNLQKIIANNSNSLVNTPLNSVITSVISNSSLQRIGGIDGGVLEDLPATIKKIDIYMSGHETGSVNNLVTKFRNAGRTSGKIQLAYIGTEAGITIDDGTGVKTCKEYATEHSIPNAATTYLTWDASSLALTTDGTGAEQPDVTWP